MFGIKIMKKRLYYKMMHDLERLDDEKAVLRKQIAQMERGANGELVCDRHCQHCKHGMEVFNPGWFMGKQFVCALAIPCKRFERDEKGND